MNSTTSPILCPLCRRHKEQPSEFPEKCHCGGFEWDAGGAGGTVDRLAAARALGTVEPTTFTADECQALLDLMDNIRDGVDLPESLDEYADDDKLKAVLSRLRHGARFYRL